MTAISHSRAYVGFSFAALLLSFSMASADRPLEPASQASAEAQSNAPSWSRSRETSDRRDGVEAKQQTVQWKASTKAGEGRNILFYRDGTAGGACAYAAALNTGEFGTVTFTQSPTDFAALLASSDWDLVVSANQGSLNPGTFQTALAAFHASHPQRGIIVSEWDDVSASGYLAGFGCGFQLENVAEPLVPQAGELLAGTPSVTVQNPGWLLSFSQTVTPGSSGSTAARGGTTNRPVVARVSGNVIVNGFLSDCLVPADNAREVVRREIQYLLDGGTRTPSLRLVPQPSEKAGGCFRQASFVSYDLVMDAPPFGVAAAQVSVDHLPFDFVGVAPGDPPFDSVPWVSTDAKSAKVSFIASVSPGFPGGVTGTQCIARLTFRTFGDDCGEVPQVRFSPETMPILLASGDGDVFEPPLVDPAPIVVDDTGPSLLGVPDDVSVPATSIEPCEAAVELVRPTAVDNCSGKAFVSASRSDSMPLDSPFPCGTTVVTWTATDDCGRSTSAQTEVTVRATTVTLLVAYQGGNPVGASRCFRVRMGSQQRDVSIRFFDSSSTWSAEFLVPEGEYDCATVDDPAHTLVSRVPVGVNGTGLVIWAAFEDALVNGDLNDDNLVNVVDWAIYVVRDGFAVPIDTECTVGDFHPDFDGNGVVEPGDGNRITGNFLRRGDTPCGTAGATAPPQMRVRIDELAALIGPNASLADLNGDGVVDLRDVQAWQAAGAAGSTGTHRR